GVQGTTEDSTPDQGGVLGKKARRGSKKDARRGSKSTPGSNNPPVAGAAQPVSGSGGLTG
ncbi:MAG: hypothetical protein WKF96_12140, partial [Solirubrobacteraceae bacterium]